MGLRFLLLTSVFVLGAHFVYAEVPRCYLKTTSAWAPSVIYGNDDRIDVYRISNPAIREVADSTVGMVLRSLIVSTDRGLKNIRTESFGQAMKLCSEEAFFDQPTAPDCSGSLVGEDLILTAGHCIENAADCRNYAFVFNFRMQNAQTPPGDFVADDIYNCKNIISRKRYGNQDYAIVQVDRPVRGHRILSLSKDPVQVGDEIYVVGHPSGLPTKVAAGAQVRRAESEYFVTNLDTYGGNSGSPVLNARTHEIVGILVRGSNDYIYDQARSCRRSNVCDDEGCKGEEASDISQFRQVLKPIY